MSDLWSLDHCIPLNNSLLIELIRAATVWVIWLTRNNSCFTDSPIPPIQSIGCKIIALTSFWCKSRLDDSYFKLTLILPMNTSFLTQAGLPTTLLVTDTSSEEDSSWDSEKDPCRGLEGSDLSEYLWDRIDLEAMGHAVIMISSDPSHSSSSSSSDECSYADSSTTS